MDNSLKPKIQNSQTKRKMTSSSSYVYTITSTERAVLQLRNNKMTVKEGQVKMKKTMLKPDGKTWVSDPERTIRPKGSFLIEMGANLVYKGNFEVKYVGKNKIGKVESLSGNTVME